ncbi:MAG: FKBP-type peptidyl-prolyl cis-trans isomerase [Bacteroidetes bacterium]|nr:FKBP-type peptidyl-prolyl cis-trans isomerase [Bacteroidota bacterium]
MTACAQDKTESVPELKTDMEKISYAIGNNIGKSFQMQGTDVDLDILLIALKDGMAGRSQMTDEEINQTLTNYQVMMRTKQEEQLKKDGEVHRLEGEKFLAENLKKEGVKATASGLQYKVLKSGSGPKPEQTDKVKVHYSGRFIDGQEFDSSYKRNQPATFPVIGVIPGWIEVLQLMSVGDKWEVYIPYNLSYGERGKQPNIPPYKSLIFEIELLDIVKNIEK